MQKARYDFGMLMQRIRQKLTSESNKELSKAYEDGGFDVKEFFKPDADDEPNMYRAAYIKTLKSEGWFINVIIGELSRLVRKADPSFTVEKNRNFAYLNCATQSEQHKPKSTLFVYNVPQDSQNQFAHCSFKHEEAIEKARLLFENELGPF